MRNFIFLLTGCFLFLWTSLSGFAQNVNIPDPDLKEILVNYEDPVIDTNGDGEIQFSEAEAIHKLVLQEGWSYYAPIFSDPTGLEAFINIKYLEIKKHPITALNIQPWAQLDTLILENTEIEEFNITPNQNLKVAWFKYNYQLNSFISDNPNLKRLKIQSGNLNSLDLSGIPNLTDLELDQNNLTQIDLSQNTQLKSLNISFSPLMNIDLSQNTLLTFLELTGTSLTSIDLSQNTLLEILRLTQNPLTDIDLSQNTVLTALNLSNNPLNSLDLSNNIDLSYLNINETSLTSIDLSQLTELKQLDLVRSKLLELDVSNNPLLEKMSLFYSDDLYYVNMRNGNTADILLNEGFGGVSNIQLVCVDDVDELQGIFYLNQLANYGAVVTTNCGLIEYYNIIEGHFKYNLEDNCDDDDAFGIPYVYIKSTGPNEASSTLTAADGSYNLFVGEGSQEVVYNHTFLPYFSVVPNSHQLDFDGFNQTEEADFCLEPTMDVADLVVTLSTPTELFPNGNYGNIIFGMSMTVENLGTDLVNGELTFMTDLYGEETVMTFPISDLKPFHTMTKGFCLPPPLGDGPPYYPVGETFTFKAWATPMDNDITPEDNYDEVVLTVQPLPYGILPTPESYFFKAIKEGEEITLEDKDDHLHYTIFFRNPGYETIEQIRITNILDNNVDVSTLKITSVSHPHTADLTDDRVLNFYFEDIYLPEQPEVPNGFEDTDYLGYITYKIKPKSSIEIGDVIGNPAYAYYNDQPPVATNKPQTKIVEELDVPEHQKMELSLYPNPTSGMVHILKDEYTNLKRVRVYSITGKKMLEETNDVTNLDFSHFAPGLYIIELLEDSGQRAVKKVIRK